VEGIDIAADAVEKAMALAKSAGVTISATIADLENGYRLPPAAYDVVICFYYLHRPLIAEMRAALKAGGVIVYETYNCGQLRWGRPRNPDHRLKHNELLDMFGDYRILDYRQGIIEPRKAISSIIARKPQLL